MGCRWPTTQRCMHACMSFFERVSRENCLRSRLRQRYSQSRLSGESQHRSGQSLNLGLIVAVAYWRHAGLKIGSRKVLCSWPPTSTQHQNKHYFRLFILLNIQNFIFLSCWGRLHRSRQYFDRNCRNARLVDYIPVSRSSKPGFSEHTSGDFVNGTYWDMCVLFVAEIFCYRDFFFGAEFFSGC